MSESPYAVRKATQDDHEAICEIYHASHQANSSLHRLFHRYGWDEDRVCGSGFVKQYLGERDNLIAAVAVTPSGQIIGFAMWSHIVAKDLKAHRRAINGEDIAKIGQDNDDPIYGEILREWISVEDSQLREWGKQHAGFWYLTLIGVDESHCNKGISYKLTNWGRKQANWSTDHGVEAQEPLFIMSTVESLGHWQRNGWKHAGETFHQSLNPSILKIPMKYSPVAKLQDEASLGTYEDATRNGKEGESIVVEL